MEEVAEMESIWFQEGFDLGNSSVVESVNFNSGFDHGVSLGAKISIELVVLRELVRMQIEKMRLESVSSLKIRTRLNDLLQKIDRFPRENDAKTNFVEEMETLRTSCQVVGISWPFDRKRNKNTSTDW